MYMFLVNTKKSALLRPLMNFKVCLSFFLHIIYGLEQRFSLSLPAMLAGARHV